MMVTNVDKSLHEIQSDDLELFVQSLSVVDTNKTEQKLLFFLQLF